MGRARLGGRPLPHQRRSRSSSSGSSCRRSWSDLADRPPAELIGLGAGDQPDGHRRPDRVGLPGDLPAALAQRADPGSATRTRRPGTSSSSPGRGCAAWSRWRPRWRCRSTRWPSRARPDHLPDLLRHPRDARRAGPDAAVAHPPPRGRRGDGRARAEEARARLAAVEAALARLTRAGRASIPGTSS